MDRNNKIKFKYYIYAIIPIVSFILVSVMTTYAFYLATVSGNEDNGEVEMKSAQVYAMFNAKNSIEVNDIYPGYKGTLEFSIYNTSTEEDLYGNYTIFWDIITNEINTNDFIYTLEGISEKDGKVIDESEKNKLVSVTSPTTIPNYSSNLGMGTINTGVVHKYTLTINFVESGHNQDEFQGKKFEGKISAKGAPNI